MIVPCRILGRHLIAVSLAAGIAGGTSSLASMPLAVNSDSVGSFGDITRFSTDVRFNSGSIQPRVLVDMNKVVRRAKRLGAGDVFALDVRRSRLSFDKISTRYRNQLVSAWGDNARAKYESKVSQKMAMIVQQIRDRVPGIKVGVVGFPEVPSGSGFNQNYSELLSSVDVFLPRLNAENSTSSGMETLMALAGDRPIMPASYQGSGATESATTGSGDPGSESSAISAAEIEALLDALTSQEAINMMQTAWGTADSTWDFNGDGIVGGHDLAILLAYIGNLGQDADDSDANGDSSGNDNDTDDDPEIDPGAGNDSGADSDSDDGGTNDRSDSGSDDAGSDDDGGSTDDGLGNDSNETGDDGNDDAGEEQGEVDDSGIAVLIPGPGFTGSYGNPMRVGSPSSPGYGAKSIARWTEFPFITRDKDFYVTISAFHMTDIDRVEFILDGGDPVVTREVQPHPETGYAEYIAKVDVSDLASGDHEIRAIIYPNHGIPRILQGVHDTSNIHMLNNGNQSFWFNYEPSPRTVRVGSNSQFSSIDDAIDTMGSLIIDGRIELEAGEYTWFNRNHSGLNNTENDRVLTICAAPGVSRDEIILRGHSSQNSGARHLSVHLKGMTILAEKGQGGGNSNGVILKGTSGHSNRLFLEDIFLTSGFDNSAGWASAELPEVTKVLTNWTAGLWVKDMDFENYPQGINTVYLAKHTTINRASKDTWGQSPGAIINCSVDKQDHYNADHELHADIIQFFVTGDYVENRIFADITATNDYSQIGHLAWSSKLSNFAFARWTVDARYPSQSLNFHPNFDHLVMTDCTFRSCSVDFLNNNKHVLLRNLLTYKYRGDQVSDAFDQATTIIDNVHFTVQHAGSPSWATHGEVNWAAPSAPTGSSSDGSGQYIPSFVQTESQLTNWSLGNPNAEDSTDHYYYDPALLDLRWWR